MLGDEDDFYSSFMSGNPEVLTQKTLGNRRLGIFTKAVEKTAMASVIDPALINQILFDRRSAHSLELAFQHAVHLVTDMHVELRTSPQNFNFIFKSYAEDDTYDGAYRWIPYVLLFVSHVIIALFDRMHPMMRESGSSMWSELSSLMRLSRILKSRRFRNTLRSHWRKP